MFLNMEKEVVALFSSRVDHHINIRARSLYQSPIIFYDKWEPQDFVLSTRRANGRPIHLQRVWDIFFINQGKPVQDSPFYKTMYKEGFSEHDLYAITTVLARFGYLFEIYKRSLIRKNVNLLQLYYAFQLNALKGKIIKGKDRLLTVLFRNLLDFLSTDSDYREKFSIEKGKFVFHADDAGKLFFSDVVDLIYKKQQTRLKKETHTLQIIHDFQLAVLNFLAESEHSVSLDFDDYNAEFANAYVFIEAYTHNKKHVFQVLADTLNPYQSDRELLISHFILLNYANFILNSKPKEIIKLKNFLNDDDVFLNILTALFCKTSLLRKEKLQGLGIDEYLDTATVIK